MYLVVKNRTDCWVQAEDTPKVIVSSVFIPISLLTIARVQANLLIILLQSSHVLASFGELTLLHSLANIP